MRAVRVQKEVLLERLRENRDQHRTIFEKAIDGYRKFVIADLEDKIDLLKNGKKIQNFVQFVVPEDHTKDYNRVIGMIEMTLDNEIELSESEYRQYVDDDWQWKTNFANTSSTYTSVAGTSYEDYLAE